MSRLPTNSSYWGLRAMRDSPDGGAGPHVNAAAYLKYPSYRVFPNLRHYNFSGRPTRA
jgi:hypothetical protein